MPHHDESVPQRTGFEQLCGKVKWRLLLEADVIQVSVRSGDSVFKFNPAILNLWSLGLGS
jgi:hypothetical protein